MNRLLNVSPCIDTEEKAELFEKAINILKALKIDHEASEVMLRELGTDNEVYSYLIGEHIYITANKVWEDIYNNDTLIYNNFEDYFNNEILIDL